MTLRLRASGLSDVGRARPINEDAYAIDDALGLYVVADGMGGHGHGDVASQLAVDAIRKAVRKDRSGLRRWWPFGRRRARGGESLVRAMRRANERLLVEVERDSSLTGMGTTVVALLLDGPRAVLAHVGDSRAYRVREGRLEQLTLDHTWVAEQITAGLLSEEQARQHPLKSVVTRALGGDRDVEVESLEVGLAPGDLLLLCTDGLTSMLTDQQLERRLCDYASLDELCCGLIEDANEQGGRDNVTALALLVVEQTDRRWPFGGSAAS